MNAIIALIAANIIWGAASPIFKYSLENIPPFTLAFIRFFFAGLLFLPFMVGFKLNRLSRKEWVELLIGTFFGITINISFFFFGLKKADSINAPIISSAGPVFLYFLSIIFLHEKAHRKVLSGMLVSLIGVIIIVLSPIFLDGKRIIAGEVEGNIFFIIATLGAVLHPILYKNVMSKINAFQATGISFLFSAFTFFPLMLTEFSDWKISSLNMQGWTGIIFGVLLSSALAYFLFNYGVAKINAQEIGLFTYIDPVIAVVIAIPLLHEYPNVYFFIGSILVFFGIYIAEKRIPWHPLNRIWKVRGS